MANELRTRTNFVGGLVEDNPLTNVATTLTSAGLAALPVIDTTNHAAIILDPDGIHGAPEIVWVTAHSASSTTATILRAQESTSARQHLRDTYWVHTATVRDFSNVKRIWPTFETFSSITPAANAATDWGNSISMPGFSGKTLIVVPHFDYAIIFNQNGGNTCTVDVRYSTDNGGSFLTHQAHAQTPYNTGPWVWHGWYFHMSSPRLISSISDTLVFKIRVTSTNSGNPTYQAGKFWLEYQEA